jgi:predicted CXXCH cytochrome family protein
MKLALAAAFAALLVASVTSGWLALADQGKVTGSAHDLGTHGAAGVSSCETCHVPHEASGEIIWDGAARPEGAFTGIAPVCYSCHDGTVAGGSYVFDEAITQHPIDREAGKDCNMCHDPHVSDYGSFLLFPSGANLCQACHEHASEADHPVNVNVHEAGHTPLDTQWDPDTGDLHGARLWDSTGRPGSDYSKCLTCHAAHAGSGDSLLATSVGDGTSIPPAFCQNCHNREVTP